MLSKYTPSLLVAALALAAACSSEEPEDPNDPMQRAERIASRCAERGIAQNLCALVGTKESVECKHGPWTYRMRRDSWAVTIECTALGDYAPAELAGASRRWIQVVDSNQAVLDLSRDGSEWPAAECLLDPVVYATDRPGQAMPDKAQPQVTLRASGLSSNDSVFAPAFAFADGECTR